MEIYKYDIQSSAAAGIPGVLIQMPEGAKVLHAGHQKGVPMIWALVDSKAPPQLRSFCIIGTGWPIEEVDKLKFINTYQDSGYVWHVFEVIR